jgi:phenylacetate-CoA ligase
MLRYIVYGLYYSIIVHINQWLSPDRLKKMAEKRAIREVHRAYRTVPYYKKKYDEAGVNINDIKTLDDLKKLPFITKDEIREQFPDGIVARGLDIKKCHYSATTGSTGRSLPFVFSHKTLLFYVTTNFRVYTMIGFRPWHKIVYIKYTSTNTRSFGPLFRNTHIKSILPVEEQIDLLKKGKPDILIGYASIILEIARTLTPEEAKLIRPKFISVNSELSTKDQRDFISHVFNCPVYDEYSTEETWMIASQCKNHEYHLYIDNVWVEFLDKNGKDVRPGEIGEMVLTTTRSTVMPFIRYRIGDLGRPSNRSCSCGRGFPVLEAFDGRRDDSFILPSGKLVSSLKILNTFTMFIKKYLHLMEEFKVIQKKRDLVVIELVKGKQYKQEQFQELIDQLNRIFGEPVTIKVEMVKSIPDTGAVKRKAIESMVNKREIPGI